MWGYIMSAKNGAHLESVLEHPPARGARRLIAARVVCGVFIMALLTLLTITQALRIAPAQDAPALSALIQILKDPAKNTAEKGNACLKLMEMGARANPAIPALIPLLQNKDELMRDYAITTLKKIGPASSSALPALEKVAASDPSQEIRSLAADAVRAISGSSIKPDAGKPKPPNQTVPSVRQNPTPEPGSPKAPSTAGRSARDMSWMATIFPELAKMAAPDWVKPGLRLTYYAASATIAGKGPIFQLDPQGEIFATDGSGRRFSVKPGSREEGIGGHGYGEYTIIAVNADSIAIAADVYTMAGGSNNPRQMTRAAFLGSPGSAIDLWVNPAWLKQVKTGMNKTIRVLRTPFSVGADKRAAVAFTSSDGTMMFVYDESSGALLYRGGSGEGETGLNLRINGEQIANTPSRMLTMSTMQGQRSLSLPWTGQKPPGWVSSIRELQYSGQIGNVVRGSPNIPLPITVMLRAAARGNGWIKFQVSQSAGGVGGALPIKSQSEWMAGTDHIGSVWVPPTALAGLRPDQELDRDPITKFVTTVGRPGKESAGREMIVIRRTGKDQITDFGYDKVSGMLVYMEQTDFGLAGNMITRFSLRNSE
jgi:hypothetical protein